jgi:hypothetical protein
MMHRLYTGKERRRSNRTPHRLECKVVINEKNCFGITENISGPGLCFRFLTSTSSRRKDFSYDARLKVWCRISPREIMHLEGLTRWTHFHDDPSMGLFDFMGIELVEPPSVYNEFIIGL